MEQVAEVQVVRDHRLGDPVACPDAYTARQAEDHTMRDVVVRIAHESYRSQNQSARSGVEEALRPRGLEGHPRGLEFRIQYGPECSRVAEENEYLAWVDARLDQISARLSDRPCFC